VHPAWDPEVGVDVPVAGAAVAGGDKQVFGVKNCWEYWNEANMRKPKSQVRFGGSGYRMRVLVRARALRRRTIRC